MTLTAGRLEKECREKLFMFPEELRGSDREVGTMTEGPNLNESSGYCAVKLKKTQVLMNWFARLDAAPK